MRYFILFALLLFSAPVFAAAGISTDSNAPVEISAKHSLEWNRKAKTYTAREDAIAKQGDMQVSSDTLTAHYSDSSGATDITLLVANGNVVIVSPPYKVYGDKATYIVAENSAVMTGGDLRIETATEKLTAKDKIEFFGRENRLVATGDAVAVRGTDTLKANLLNAFFHKAADDKMTLEKITADGNVVIKTIKETVTGSKGVYDVVSGKAVLTGKIRILQGDNWLEGTRAEVDLKTGVSKLFAEGNRETEGRVKGMFFPKKKPQ